MSFGGGRKSCGRDQERGVAQPEAGDATGSLQDRLGKGSSGPEKEGKGSWARKARNHRMVEDKDSGNEVNQKKEGDIFASGKEALDGILQEERPQIQMRRLHPLRQRCISVTPAERSTGRTSPEERRCRRSSRSETTTEKRSDHRGNSRRLLPQRSKRRRKLLQSGSRL